MRALVVFNWIVLLVCLAGWPLTATTIFRHEPQGILGLSWCALILSATGNLIAAYVKKDVS